MACGDGSTTRFVLTSVVILCVILDVCESYRVLLIGDSIDRYIVQDWCYVNRPKPPKTEEWQCPDCIQWHEYTEHKASSLICQQGNDSIANLFLFGSKEEPRYFQNYGWKEMSHTRTLLPRGTQLYFEKFGPPNLIVFQIMFWDIGYLYDHFHDSFPEHNRSELNIPYSSAWNASLAWYESNIRKRIHELQVTVSKCTNNSVPVNIALRTSVYNHRFGALIHDMNALLRALAIEFDFSFYDFHDDLWSIYHYHYENLQYQSALMREDGYHPQVNFTIAAAEKLLGWKYTRNMIYRGSFTPRYPICLFFAENPATVVNTIRPYTCLLTNLTSNEFTRIRAVALFNPTQRWKKISNPLHLHYVFFNSSVSIRIHTIHYPSIGAVVRKSEALPNIVRMKWRISPAEVLLLPHSVFNQIPFLEKE